MEPLSRKGVKEYVEEKYENKYKVIVAALVESPLSYLGIKEKEYHYIVFVNPTKKELFNGETVCKNFKITNTDEVTVRDIRQLFGLWQGQLLDGLEIFFDKKMYIDERYKSFFFKDKIEFFKSYNPTSAARVALTKAECLLPLGEPYDIEEVCEQFAKALYYINLAQYIAVYGKFPDTRKLDFNDVSYGWTGHGTVQVKIFDDKTIKDYYEDKVNSQKAYEKYRAGYEYAKNLIKMRDLFIPNATLDTGGFEMENMRDRFMELFFDDLFPHYRWGVNEKFDNPLGHPTKVIPIINNGRGEWEECDTKEEKGDIKC